MAFNITANVYVVRDSEGIVRHLRHLQEPYLPDEMDFPFNPRKLAGKYLRDVATIYGVTDEMLTALGQPIGITLTNEGPRLRLAVEKSLTDTTTVSFTQTYFGLPVWESGIHITIQPNFIRVTSSYSTLHLNLRANKPKPNAPFTPERLNASVLAKVLGLKPRAPRPKMNGTRSLIYGYDPATRHDPESVPGQQPPGWGGPPTLTLPKLHQSIKPGGHYVVTEALFTLALPKWGSLNWRALVEVETGAVLYLRAFVACATGLVFPTDPATDSGDPTLTPASPVATLDLWSSRVTLQGLIPANPQLLSGNFVYVNDTDLPNIPPPTTTSPFQFDYSADTPDFAATNAYHHCDALFRMVQDMGFPIATYFDGTTFPVPVDHRAESLFPGSMGVGIGVGAMVLGNTSSSGTSKIVFGLAQAGTTVGIAADARIVAHEFCHVLMWDHVHNSGLAFAHSAGDSLAAILSDPASKLSGLDRFQTFPWIKGTPALNRRHDRPLPDWAWGNNTPPNGKDTGGYNSEEILTTTLFRFYLSIGGDANHSDPAIQLARRQVAANDVVYIIVKAIGLLTGLVPSADVFATTLMNADTVPDTTVPIYQGHPCGTLHKVIRWAFEKQGLYGGAPPDIDVYIDDGRNGEYKYKEDFWDTTDIWNRNNADGGLIHEAPIVSRANYVYVKVKNRGTQPASNLVVRGFNCKPGAGMAWPGDWQAMTTASISVPGPLAPNGGQTIVEPFEWWPQMVGHECLLMDVSAPGDLSNADPSSMLPCSTGPTPVGYLVPFDNNIAQRNVYPISASGGSGLLTKRLHDYHFWVINPHDRSVRVVLEPDLPDFLRRRKWTLRFMNPGGASFMLGPFAEREVIPTIKEGSAFSTEDVEAAGADAVIKIRALVDGQVIGGMSYVLDPRMEPPTREDQERPGKHDSKT